MMLPSNIGPVLSVETAAELKRVSLRALIDAIESWNAEGPIGGIDDEGCYWVCDDGNLAAWCEENPCTLSGPPELGHSPA